MRISRIRIEQLRRFARGLQIDDLSEGINLFVGANEAGKSTIAEAIRAAFFERHRSGSVEHLRPWGDSAAAPSIDIDFVLDGRPATLRKRFLQRKRCELDIDGRRLEGVEAEDHLAQLLGFGFAGKGRSGAEHRGIPGLLWIEQGRTQDLEQAVGHAADHLQRALGGVTSSAGDAVLEQLEHERNELLTQSQGKPRGEYATALASQAELAQRLAEMDLKVREYRERVDQLESLQREHARDDAHRPWLVQRAQEAKARAGLADVERMRGELGDAQRQLGLARQRHALYLEQLAGFEAQSAQLAARRTELADATLGAQSTQRALSACREGHAQAQAAADAAGRALELARRRQLRLELAAQLDELQARVERMRGSLAEALTEQQAGLRVRAEADATGAGDEDLALLREQHARQRELQAVQESVATRLRYRLEPGLEIGIGGQTCSGEGEALIVAPTLLALPGLGSIELLPGGDKLAGAARELQDLAVAHESLLRRVGVASLAEAEARQRRNRELLVELRGRETALKLLAPQGIDALRAELAGLEARLQAQRESLAQLPQPAQDTPDAPDVLQAQAADEAARQELERQSRELQRSGLAAAQASSAQETARRELQAVEAVMNAPDRGERLRAAQQELLQAGAEMAAQQQRIDALQAGIAAVEPELLEQDAKRCGASAQALEREHAERGARIARLEVELETLGAQGLEEARGELHGEFERCERRVDELSRRARALEYLVRLMRDRRSALTRRLHAPLQRHLDRYVQMLFPQARLEVGDDLVPRWLSRAGGEPGSFEELSFGAREQLGLVSRLAYADLLRESGRPTLLILDDALVHSDDERLERMKRVLFDAAGRHQLLLFTCHPEKWRDLGVRPRAVAELPAAG